MKVTSRKIEPLKFLVLIVYFGIGVCSIFSIPTKANEDSNNKTLLIRNKRGAAAIPIGFLVALGLTIETMNRLHHNNDFHSEEETGIILYHNTNFQGSKFKLNRDSVGDNECINLPPNWKNKVESVNSGGACIRVWYMDDCKNAATKIAPGTRAHHDLSLINGKAYNGERFKWANNIESISGCNYCKMKQQHDGHMRNRWSHKRMRRSISSGTPVPSFALKQTNRTKRFAHDWFEHTDCDTIAETYMKNYLEEAIATYTIDGGSPIDSVIYRWWNGVRYPLAVHAIIGPRHIGHERTNFGSNFDRQMTIMQAMGYGNNFSPRDEKGHLVASQLGGPIEWYNLVPQTGRVNRNLGNAGADDAWILIENQIKRHIQSGWCSHADYSVMANYNTYGDGTLMNGARRPIGFKLCIRLYDGNNELVENGVIDRYYQNIN